MATDAQLTTLLLEALTQVPDNNKAIDIAEVPSEHLPFFNIRVDETAYEGNNGQYSSSITQKQTGIFVEITIGTTHGEENSYEVLSRETRKVVAAVYSLTGRDAAGNAVPSTPFSDRVRSIGIVDMWIEGQKDYEAPSELPSMKSLGCDVGIQIKHRGE